MASQAPKAVSRLQSSKGLREIFNPRCVAVVGASPKPGSVGGVILNNIKRGGFERPVYVVHPAASTVHGFAAVPKIASIKEQVDLAIIVIPAQHVNAVARECGKKARNDFSSDGLRWSYVIGKALGSRQSAAHRATC